VSAESANAETIEEPPLPRHWPDTEFYWTSGADGQWRFLHCCSCERIIHPPAPYCPRCGGNQTEPRPVSGAATVYSYSVVHQPFIPWVPVPYVLAIVSPEEDAEVRVTTRVVECQPEEVIIGMRVRVGFEQHGDTYLPVFSPEEGVAP